MNLSWFAKRIASFLIPVAVAILALGLGIWRCGSMTALVAVIRRDPIAVEFPPHLGSLRHGDTVNTWIMVRNLTATPIRVIGGAFGCTCISTTSLPAEISPYENRVLQMKLDVRGIGEKKHPVVIYVEDDVKHRRVSGMLQYRVLE